MAFQRSIVDFKPTFRVTDAVYICTKKVPIEESKYLLKFLLRTHPFSKYYKKAPTPSSFIDLHRSSHAANKSQELIRNHETISKIIRKDISSLSSTIGDTQFNDQKILDKISKFLNSDLSNKLLLISVNVGCRLLTHNFSN